MGRAVITEKIREGLYKIKPLYNTAPLEAELSKIDAAIAKYAEDYNKALVSIAGLEEGRDAAKEAVNDVMQNWFDGLISKDNPSPEDFPESPIIGQSASQYQATRLLEIINAARDTISVDALDRVSVLDNTIRYALESLINSNSESDRIGPEKRATENGYAYDAAVGMVQFFAFACSAADKAVESWLGRGVAILDSKYTECGVVALHKSFSTYGYYYGIILGAPGSVNSVTYPPNDVADTAAKATEEKLNKIKIPETKTDQPQSLQDAVAKFAKAAEAYNKASNALEKIKLDQLNRVERKNKLELIQQQTANEIWSWCADYNEDLALNAEVETIEFPGFLAGDGNAETTTFGIRGPAPEESYSYTRRDINILSSTFHDKTKLRPSETLSDRMVFYNAAMEPGWERWKPMLRYGTLTAINDTVCNVTLEARNARGLGDSLAIDSDENRSLSNVTINYPCGPTAFEVGDNVLVLFTDQDRTKPVVVGFKLEPKLCIVQYDIDSGYLSIGVYNSGAGSYIVERPVLYQNATTNSLSSLLGAAAPSPFEHFGPTEPTDDDTPKSFDYPADTETLWNKVKSLRDLASPGNWSGKLRLMGQARYGRVLASDWNLGVPSFVTGSTEGYGLYTDANHKYWIVHVLPNVAGTQIDLTATLLDSPLYDTILPVVGNSGSSNDEKLIAETYALAFASASSTVLTKTISSSTALDGLPLAYQWHWLWDGSEARIVLNKNMTTYFASKYFGLSIDITDGEITASVSVINSGSWAPGTGKAYVFSPLSDMSGSVCWGYGMSGTNTASAPLYCYVKTSGVVGGESQSFVTVSGSFNQSVSVAEEWLSACHYIPGFSDSFSSDTHGKIASHTATSSTLSTSDGFSVNVNERTNTSVYKTTRTNKSDYRNYSSRGSGSFTCYMENPTCGAAVSGGTYSGNRTSTTYIKTCHFTAVNYISAVSGYPVLIVPAGCADACVLGSRLSDMHVGVGYNESHADHEYLDRVEHNFDSGGSVVCTESYVLQAYGQYMTPATTRYFTEAKATYLTSFGSVPAQDFPDSWTSPISLSNPYTPNIAFIVQGVTSAARCAGADSTVVRTGNFPETVGDGKAAVIGFG